MKKPKIFSKRAEMVQQAYDIGWKHGHEVGKIDGQYEVMDIIAKRIEPLDWLQENPIEVRDILPLIKSETKHKAPTTW